MAAEGETIHLNPEDVARLDAPYGMKVQTGGRNREVSEYIFGYNLGLVYQREVDLEELERRLLEEYENSEDQQ